MANKELTAKVKLNISDAESKLNRLSKLIKGINSALNGSSGNGGIDKALEKQLLSAEKVKQATLKTEIAQEKLTQEVAKTYVAEERMNQALANTAIKQEQLKQATSKTTQAISKEYVAEERVNQALNQTAVSQERVKQAVSKTAQEIGKEWITEEKLNQTLIKTEQLQNKTKSKTDSTTQSTKQWSNAVSGVNSKLNHSSNTLSVIGGKLKRLASTYLGVMGMKAIVGTSDMITSAENKLNYINGGDTNLTQGSMDKMYASSQKVRMGYGDMMSNVSKSMALAGNAFDNSTDKAIRFQEIMAEAYAVGGASAQEMSSSMYQLIQALGAGTLAGDELRSVREGAPLAYKEIEKFAQETLNSTESLKDLASQGLITADMVTAAIMGAGDDMDKAFAQTEQRFDQTWEQIKNAAIYAFKPISKMLRTALNDAIDSGLLQKVETVFSGIAKGIMIGFQIIFNAIHWVADNWSWLQYIVIFGLLVITLWFGYVAITAIQTAITTALAWLSVNGSLLLTILIIALIIVALVYLAKTSENLCEFLINLLYYIAGAIILVLAVVLMAYLATGAVMLSVPMIIALFIIALIALLLKAFLEFTGQIIGFVYGIGYSIQAICEWVNIAWQNMCSSMGSFFWNAIADMLDGCEWLLKGINKIREALGKDAISVGDIRARAEASASKGGQKLPDIGDAWNTGYAKGFAIGEGIQDKINGFGEKIKGLGGDGLLDNLGSKLGLDFTGLNKFPSSFDPNMDLSNLGGGLGDIGDKLGKIGGDTGKIADSVELTDEDLEYLRKIAEMEWKKEYTTASIKVDMSNYNTISGENDLDGIVTKLSEKLYEELNIVADGVYA